MRSSRSNRRAYPASADLAPVSSGSSSRGRNETPTGDRRCHVWAAGCRGLGRPRGRLEVGRGGVSSREMTELSSGARSSRVRGRARDGARARMLAGNCRGPAGEIRFSRDAPCRVSAGPGGRVCAHPRSTARLGAKEGSRDERQSVARASTSRAVSLTEVVRGKRTTTVCRQKSRTLLALARGRDGRVGEVPILRRRGGGLSRLGRNLVRGLRLAHALGRCAHERVETGYVHFAANFGASARESRSDFDRRASARVCDLRRSARGLEVRNRRVRSGARWLSASRARRDGRSRV